MKATLTELACFKICVNKLVKNWHLEKTFVRLDKSNCLVPVPYRAESWVCQSGKYFKFKNKASSGKKVCKIQKLVSGDLSNMHSKGNSDWLIILGQMKEVIFVIVVYDLGVTAD